jgi:molecular chaperone GrpE
LTFLNKWQYFCNPKDEINDKMFKKIFKNMSQDTHCENSEKETTLHDEINEKALESDQALSVEEKLEEELAKEKDKFLRLFAEFENYKKRTAKERLDLFKTANQEVIEAMLPILDDFDRGLNEITKSGDENLVKGVALIYDKFNATLKNKGLELVEIKAGDDFNADFAEAITQIPAPNEALKGKIVDVVEKGYKLGDKIIRFPKVVIGG